MGWYRYGDPGKVKLPRSIQPVVVIDVAFIPLTRGKWAAINTTDLHLVQGRHWQARPEKSTFYVSSRPAGSPNVDHLHRVILGVPPADGMVVDHINRNGLDNRRSNLRWATPVQNFANTPPQAGSSRFKGVSWFKSQGTWAASIQVDNHARRIGYFHDEERAARAYDLAASEAWGEFAYLNFPEEARLRPNTD